MKTVSAGIHLVDGLLTKLEICSMTMEIVSGWLLMGDHRKDGIRSIKFLNSDRDFQNPLRSIS